MQKFLLGAYWNARPAPLEKCVDDAQRFFERLTRVDPLFGRWVERGSSRQEALQKSVDLSDKQCLADLLRKGRSRRDIGHEVMQDLGFRLGLWNGADHEEAQASIHVHCGSGSQHVGNNVLIHLPQEPGSPWIENAPQLLALVADTWRPRWAGIISKKALRKRPLNADCPYVDWMVYVPRSIDSIGPPARLERVGDIGTIVIAQPEPTTGEDAEELSRIRSVERILAA